MRCEAKCSCWSKFDLIFSTPPGRFVAVVLDNFRSTYDMEAGLVSEDDFELFKELWFEFDPHNQGYFQLHRLREFMSRLPPSLGIPADDRFGYLVLRSLMRPSLQRMHELRQRSGAQRGNSCAVTAVHVAAQLWGRIAGTRPTTREGNAAALPPFNALLFALCRFHSGHGALPYRDQVRATKALVMFH